LSDEARFAALAQYDVLDTPRESDFDEIVQLAAQICGVPGSVITLIDRDRQWFKASVGFGEVREAPLEESMCRKLIHEETVSVVPNAKLDPRFNDNIMVHGEYGLRFYAGAPLRSSEGVPIGMLCVLDKEPHTLSDQQKSMLKVLAKQVMIQLELRRILRQQVSLIRDTIAARNEAEASSIQKTEVLNNLNHELRTPLNVILGFSELLAKSQMNEKQRDYLSTLHGSAESMLQLVNNMLDMSKLEANAVELEHTPFSLRKMAAEVVSMLSLAAQAKNLDLVFDDTGLQQENVMGDPTRLRQVILNLCANAIKFTHQGSVTLAMTSVQVDDDADPLIMIEVRDTGIGIPQDKLSLIFDRFSQADTSINRKFGGTGLGLAISKKIVASMGGRLLVESTEGKGSRFFFIIPLDRAQR